MIDSTQQGSNVAEDVTVILIDHADRLGSIEATQKAILDSLTRHTKVDEEVQKAIHEKLDEIVSLKHKGLGAFWLASGIVGLVVAALGSNVVQWIISLWSKH